MRATGIAKATASDLAGGKRPFTVAHMNAIANVIGLPGRVFMPGTAKD